MGFFASETIMQRSTQVVQIRTRSSLPATMLLWRCKAGGPELLSITWQTLLEDTRDPEINQVDVSFRSHHNIRGFEVTENDRRGLLMQVGEHTAQLQSITQDIFDWQVGCDTFFEQLFERFAFNKIHHQVGSSVLVEKCVDTWQIGV